MFCQINGKDIIKSSSGSVLRTPCLLASRVLLCEPLVVHASSSVHAAVVTNQVCGRALVCMQCR